MINKRKLVDNIEKYYLNGLTEAVKFNIKNNVLIVPFTTINQDVVGEITLPIELPDATFGIFETSPFLKLLNILDTNLDIQYQERYGIVDKLLIEDNQYKMRNISCTFICDQMDYVVVLHVMRSILHVLHFLC